MKYFGSDWHLSHEKIISMSNRPFSSVKEMNETIVNNVLSLLKPGDDFYFLGDLSFDFKTTQWFFDQWPKQSRFHWILGNHERSPEQFKKYCKTITPLLDIKLQKHPVTLCHYPMITWNKSHYNAWMLYGHHHCGSHGTDKLGERASGKMLNVNVEFHDYKPWSENQIVEYMKTKSNNWDIIEK